MQAIERFVHRCTHEQRAPCHRAHGAPDSAVRFTFNGVELRQSYGVNDGDHRDPRGPNWLDHHDTPGA